MRYGEEDFDQEYIESGFTDLESQTKEAESALAIVDTTSPIRILDLGCGIGTHATRWATAGHDVTAVDISPTFLATARETAAEAGVEVDFRVGSLEDLDFEAEFDLVTCIEYLPIEDEALEKLAAMLRPKGFFLFDLRNPFHPDAIRRRGNSRTWHEEDGVFHLERHETDTETNIRTDEWITIDPDADLIDERYLIHDASESKLNLYYRAERLLTLGFETIEFRTIGGEVFKGGTEPYWLWCVARRGG